jgi:hypothetical protein
MRPAILIDESLWPLLIIRFVGTVSDEQFEQYLVRTSAVLQRKERCVSLFDGLQLGMPTASQRNRQVEWLRQDEALMREFLLGTAYVLGSPVHRLMLSMILHVIPPPMPYVVAPSLSSAVAWLGKRLEEAGLELSQERVLSHLGLTPKGRVG